MVPRSSFRCHCQSRRRREGKVGARLIDAVEGGRVHGGECLELAADDWVAVAVRRLALQILSLVPPLLRTVVLGPGQDSRQGRALFEVLRLS